MNTVPKPFADIIQLANTIMAHTLDEGGGTFDFEGNIINPACFVVGGKGEAIKITIYDNGEQNNQGGVDRLAAYLQRQPSVGGSKPLIGTWLHEGQVHVDNVSLHQSYVDAVTQAFHRDQISFWDGAKHACIFIKE